MYEFVIKRRPRTMHRKLSVHGLTKPKGKVRHAKWPPPEEQPKPGVHMYVPGEIKAFIEEVGWAAKAGGVKPIFGPVGVHINTLLYLEAPNPQIEQTLGDGDNFAIPILNGLKHIAYDDDYQVRNLIVNKDYVDSPQKESAIVRIGTMQEMRLPDGPADMLAWVMSKIGLTHKRETRRIVIEVDKFPLSFVFDDQGEFVEAEIHDERAPA